MTQAITTFRFQHAFLSNFYRSPVLLDGIRYHTAEHAFQAAKAVSPAYAKRIRECDHPGQAKRLGRRIPLRANWDKIRIPTMKRVLVAKFSDHELADKLLATGDAELIHDNSWGDAFWGHCPEGHGFNHLGRLLMEVRAEIKARRAR